MAIDPYKGGKCWSCKYCEDVGYYDENLDTVYKRKCSYPGKDYLEYCTKYCASYVWDGKDSEFNYTCRSVPSGSYYDSKSTASSGSSSSSGSTSSSYSSSSSSGSSGGRTGCVIALIVIALLIGATVFFLTGKPASMGVSQKETTSQSTSNHKTATIQHTGNVNLRKKASSKSDIITAMAPGTTVHILDETESWAKVTFEDKTGWCFKKYLKYNTSP